MYEANQTRAGPRFIGLSNTRSVFQTLPLWFPNSLPSGSGVWKPQRECLENLGVFDSNTPQIFQTLPLRPQTPSPPGREFGTSEGVFEKLKGCLSQTPQGFPNTPSVVSKLPNHSSSSIRIGVNTSLLWAGSRECMNSNTP